MCTTIDKLNISSQTGSFFLQFHPGRHILNRSDFITFESIPEVHMVGNAALTEIVCQNTTGIMFTHVDNVVVLNLSFLHCGGLSHSTVPAYIPSAIFLHFVSNFSLDGITIYESRAIGVFISESYGKAEIRDSVIALSPIANVICIYNSNNTFINTSFELLLQNLYIMHGGSAYLNEEKSGGINIEVGQMESSGKISLENITFFNNSGRTGGNLKINVSQCNKCHPLNISVSNSKLSNGLAFSGGGISYIEKCCCPQCLMHDVTSTSICHHFTLENTTIINNRAIEKGGGIELFIDVNTNIIFILFYNLSIMSNSISSRTLLSQPSNLFAGGGLNFHLISNNVLFREVPVITISLCKFERNLAYSSAGFLIAIDVLPTVTSYSPVTNTTDDVLVVIKYSIIANNTASYAAGAHFLIHDTSSFHANVVHQVSVVSSIFEDNSAGLQASGLLISSMADYENFQFKLYNVSFIDNEVKMMIIENDYYSVGVPSTLLLHSLSKVSLSDCVFNQNIGSGMSTFLSQVSIDGYLNFSHNNARMGAGMNLVDSYLEISTNSLVTFSENHASEVGGAIYTHNQLSPSNSCFFSLFGNFSTNRTIFYFVNNSAYLAGDVLYERTPSNCTIWRSNVNNSFFLRASQLLHQVGLPVASDPYQICYCQENDTYNCDSISISVSIVIGSFLTVPLTITDQNGLPTPGIIVTANRPHTRELHSIRNDQLLCSKYTYQIIENHTSKVLVIFPMNYKNQRSSDYKQFSISISILPCPTGFILSKTNKKCECLPYIEANELFTCNSSNFSILRRSKAWIGTYLSSLIVYNSCPFGYCVSGKFILHNNNFNELCISGHSGLLCGGCQPNLSLALGNSKCMKCSDHYISLILVFGALGIILIMIITGFNLTITEGYVNGVIFYTAFLHLNRDSLFPEYHNNTTIFVILISWLNLDFGFNVCFYNGMTPYVKVWLQFLFPIYLYSIQTVVILLSYRSSKLARISGARNRIKIMSTLFLLGYMKMLRSVLTILSFARLEVPTSMYTEFKTVWLYDGNIDYFSGKHTTLFVIAVVFIGAISIPYTTVLLFIQVLQRLTHFPCQVKKNGIVDVHVGPFKKKSQFWLGLLLVAYTTLASLNSFTGGDKGINITALIVICSVLLLMLVILGGVYKNKALDYFESAFLFNVVVFSALILQKSGDANSNITITVYIFIITTFIIIFIVFLYYFFTGCRNRKFCSYLLSWKPWKKSSTSESPWSNNYQELEEVSLSTTYVNAKDIIDSVNENCSDTYDKELIPVEWQPTKFPLPLFRENPDLLKSHDQFSFPERKLPIISSPTTKQVQTSLLIVNKLKDDVSLMPESDECSRSQRLSVDNCGNKTYVIENTENNTQKTTVSNVMGHSNEKPLSATTLALQKSADPETKIPLAPKVSNSSHKDIQRLSYSSIKTPPCDALEIQKIKKRRSSIKKMHLPVKKIHKTAICRRPQPGTICHKCQPLLPLQCKIRKFKVNHTGKEYCIKSHDIVIKIPPLAVTVDVSIDVEVGVLLHGPFVLPPNSRPISPIVWLCVKNKVNFHKPIDITIPHFIKDQPFDAKKLGIKFMKASHHTHLFPNGKKMFSFNPVGRDSTTHFTSLKGTLKTHHFCFLCIAAPDSKDLHEHAAYCLTRVDPLTWNPSIQRQEIYFIVSYFLSTCLQVSIIIIHRNWCIYRQIAMKF